MLILFTEIFIVTFINDCAVTTIFTISLLRLRSVNLLFNICIGDDTKAAARQSPNCIKKQKNKIKYGKKTVFTYYTLQHGTIMTLILLGDCTLQCGMWLWNHDSEFTKWQHPAV